MRVTKTYLQARLDAERNFQRLKLQFVMPEDIEALRNTRGFVSVCEYGAGMPLKYELGRNATHRFFTAIPVDGHWKPPP